MNSSNNKWWRPPVYIKEVIAEKDLEMGVARQSNRMHTTK